MVPDINGQKMSKSRGTFITARRYLDSFKAEYLRYYFAAKLSSGIDDIDMNLDEFTTRLNSDIVGKLVNIASRCAGSSPGMPAVNWRAPCRTRSCTRHSRRQLRRSRPRTRPAKPPLRSARSWRWPTGRINTSMHASRGPSRSIPTRRTKSRASAPGPQPVSGLDDLPVPVLPDMAAQTRHFFQEAAWTWDSAARPLLGTTILPYQALATRLEPKAVARLVEPPPEPAQAASSSPAAAPAIRESDAAAHAAAAAVEGNLISIDDFLRVDLRVARVVGAELIAGADKLLKLRLDVGELGQREIFAGIRAAYEPGR